MKYFTESKGGISHLEISGSIKVEQWEEIALVLVFMCIIADISGLILGIL